MLDRDYLRKKMLKLEHNAKAYENSKLPYQVEYSKHLMSLRNAYVNEYLKSFRLKNNDRRLYED